MERRELMRRGISSFIALSVLGALVAGLLFVGCDDDDDDNGVQPDPITIADFEGTWQATSFTLINKANPQVAFDLILLGGTFTFQADAAGNFTGQAVLPAIFGGQTIPFAGTVALLSQTTVEITFTPEIEPFLTSFTGEFELSGDMIEFIDDDSSFDFDEDGEEEPARFEGTLVRS
jgi:hypothetical protein